MKKWLIKLEGEKFDLEEFPFWFPDGEIYAISEGDNVFLSGDRLSKIDQADKVFEVASLVLDEYFAIISLIEPSIKRPMLGNVYFEDETGQRKGFAFASVIESGRIKVKATASIKGDATIKKEPTKAQILLAASNLDPRLNLIILLWADTNQTWPRLYRIMEEIEKFFGEPIHFSGFCTREQRDRFKHSANSPEVAGRDSRHATMNFQPPKNPMTINEAISFIRMLIESTLLKAANNKK